MSSDHFDEYGLNPEGVTMARTPFNTSDSNIIRLYEGSFTNAETILGNKPLNKSVIDLQRRYDIHVDYEGAAPKSMQFSAIDRLTYDPDSGGINSCIGYGETRREATLDLLAQIAGYDEAKAVKP